MYPRGSAALHESDHAGGGQDRKAQRAADVSQQPPLDHEPHRVLKADSDAHSQRAERWCWVQDLLNEDEVAPYASHSPDLRHSSDLDEPGTGMKAQRPVVVGVDAADQHMGVALPER